MLNATFQSGAYTRKVADIKAQTIVEIKFPQDAGEIIAVYPQVSLNSAEVASGRITLSARLVCTAVFTDSDGKLARIQKGAEFSHHADDDRLAPAQNADCELICEHTQIKRDGSTYVIAIVVGAKIAVSESAQRNYISDVSGAIARREEGKLFNAVAFSGESDVDDEFDCVAGDILVPCAKAQVTECNVKAGMAVISGEIYLSILAVRDSAPVALDRIVPFKCELSCSEAVVPKSCVARAEIKEMAVNCKVSEDSGKCNVEFSATLAFFGRFYDEENVTYISDMFSEECALNLVKCEQSEEIYTNLKIYSERASGLCATKAKLDYTCTLLATAVPSADFVKTEKGIEGSVSAVLIYKQGGETRSTEINLPFSVRLAGLEVNGGEVRVAVSGMSVRQRAEGECEAEAILKITAEDGEKNRAALITEASEGEKYSVKRSAICVHIPAAGDGLWDTTKKLCAPPESIEAANPDITFPLTGRERIVVFRAKT